jgi:cell wall-associated NlpC family hydrolase
MKKLIPKIYQIFSFLLLIGCSIGASGYGGTKVKSAVKKDRIDVVEYASMMINSPYRYGGRDRKGFDCSGFSHYVFKSIGVDLPVTSEAQSNVGKEIPLDDVQPGDLVYFRRNNMGRVFHVAIVYSNDKDGIKVIHSTTQQGVIIDNITQSAYWKSMVKGARNILGN